MSDHVSGAGLRPEACQIASEAGRSLLEQFGPFPNQRERARITAAFRSALYQHPKRGRRPSERVTAAYNDWLQGMRGPKLFRKHIPGFEKFGFWRRRVTQRQLMAAIQSRARRARPRAPDQGNAKTE